MNLKQWMLVQLFAFSPVIGTVSAQDSFAMPQVERRSVSQANYQSPVYHQDSQQVRAMDPMGVTAQSPPTSQPSESRSGFPSLTPHNDVEKVDESKSNSLGPLVTTGSSLAIVLGLFAALVWITRRYGNGSASQANIPSDVIANLGTTVIDARTRVTLLRCGNRIIVMAQTATGVHPLSEITDPIEVDRLTAACTGKPHASFADAMHQAGLQQPVSTPTPPRKFVASA